MILKRTLLLSIMIMLSMFRAYSLVIDGINYQLYDEDMTAVVTSGKSCSGAVIIPSHINYGNKVYTVTSVGERAFYGCSGLTSITIPDGVVNLDHYAFCGCSNLASISIGDGVTSIGFQAFWGCCGLNTVVIPNNVNLLYADAFGNCPNLTTVFINSDSIISHDYVITNDKYDWNSYNIVTFFGAQVKEYVLGNGVKSIGDYAFYGSSSLTSITIPESVTTIGQYAFYNCTNLAAIAFTENVKSIGDCAFDYDYYVNRLNYDIDVKVTVLDYSSFCDNKIMEAISLSLDHFDYNVTLIDADGNEITDFVIPNGVTSIGESAFRYCYGLTSVTIPDGIISIGPYAFIGCRGLSSITIPEGVISIGSYAFSGCINITSPITIPESVTSIGLMAFSIGGHASITVKEGNSVYDSRDNCNAIIETSTGALIQGSKNSFIPNGVTSIGECAFINCKDYISIAIPESVTSIGESAFYGCSGLSSIAIPKGVTRIGNWTFSGCSRLTSVTIPESVASIGEWAFDGCSSLASITIPESVASIGEWAFYGCNGLVSINVKEGNSVFDSRNNCNAIIETATNKIVLGCRNTIIPGDVSIIGEYAFEGCSELTSLVIPESVTNIDCSSFRACSGLDTIIVEEGNPVFDSRNNCNAIIETSTNNLILGCKNTIVPESVTRIGNYAFYGCTGLSSITIPEGVKKIGSGTFGLCSNLRYITVYDFIAISNSDGNSFISYTSESWNNNKIIIRVPQEQIQNYEGHLVWSRYKIVPFSIPLEHEIVMSDQGYCTFYDSEFDFDLPSGLIAMVVDESINDKLNYKTIASGDSSQVIPAGVPVIIKRTGGSTNIYNLNALAPSAIYQGNNLLCGSDVDTLTFAVSNSLFYKLSYGPSGTEWSDTFGWYWGAPDGAAFQIEAHKAWLTIPSTNQTEGIAGYSLLGNPTGINKIKAENVEVEDIMYDLYGRRLYSPVRKGLMIINGKKVYVSE